MKYLASLVLLVACSNGAADLAPFRNEVVIHDPDFKGKVALKTLTSTHGFKLLLQDESGATLDQAVFRYAAYRLDTADVDRNGKTDVLVGLIKSTEFDPLEKKRLFILRIDHGQLRPLWLGSKVCQELVDFRSQRNGMIMTLEKNKNDNYALGCYEWQGFGLTLIKYTHDEITFREALQAFEGRN